MGEVSEALKIDWAAFIFAVCVLIFVIYHVGSAFVTIVFKWLGIETKYQRERREQKELLENTIKKLDNLAKETKQDSKESEEHFDKRLIDFYTPYRQQSMEIQKKLEESVDSLTQSDKTKSLQIEALMEGIKELLGDKIDQKYDKYIQLNGIPSNEVDEFNSIFFAYTKLMGNHNREKKYNYVTDNLPIIPVATLYKTDDN